MLLRLTPALGGDGTVIDINVMNDTGSNILRLFTTDLHYLGNMHGYTDWHTPAAITDASGTITVFSTVRFHPYLGHWPLKRQNES